MQVQNLFRLQFIREKSNVVFLGGAGLGKAHLSKALGYEACLKGHTAALDRLLHHCETVII